MEQIAWATGIFEGEGWIKKDKRKRATFELCVQMSDLDIIQRLQQVFQTGSVYKGTTPKNPNHKQLYRWSVCSRKNVASVLNLMLPFLGQRRAYAALNALDTIELI